ncbi:MAG: cytochrome o ubiquinol oxidase operon protein cyoD [Parcubacteria group bacterium Gr01-1014_56]|nr:MAG: cytochrome o ubiquinol oxidase operon protein cyoD [Parcubacteria group bacterium Gr01-1014_56]
MGTLTKYTLGFGLSVLLTLAAFFIVWREVLFSREVLISVLITLALAQLLVQLILFLHVGSESKPMWNLAALVFALIIVAILVGGTLWIMYNLEHGQMQTQPDMFAEENIFPTP